MIARRWKLPVVFVVPHDLSGPPFTDRRTNTSDGATMLVDGNDVIALHQSMSEAIALARAGGGPTLLNAFMAPTGRCGATDNTTPLGPIDLSTAAPDNDPIRRMRAFLLKKRHWQKTDDAHLLCHCQAQINDAVSRYLQSDDNKPIAVARRLCNFLYERRRPTAPYLKCVANND